MIMMVVWAYLGLIIMGNLFVAITGILINIDMIYHYASMDKYWVRYDKFWARHKLFNKNNKMKNSLCWKCDYWVKTRHHWIFKLFGVKDYCARCGEYTKAG